ncbi:MULTISPECIES: pyridoxal 5'-phosphate synthase glutaminase subunit PdxT [unclassified Exiguobacterium]|uniref:pyridoxal 5'-phosphate synthase glutaminase subunit PdxT n=1 Tax=unclassified Exiguobacterium TaxID=2644629 RepID=UPI000B58FB86|nr:MULTISPECIES: pyridoxal 5'-phosphate synthase glutaminase subunit PdxT [unclassified Exiguobacterium]ASI34048.1 pyridoxal 5'-phosphate synthase glutaminase subunit PdxT [Exiguobacterium sp. N4-1P]ASI37040.1 pyridoxal 5'-phosphate synthase glutaminase subunit PdxT [Exiguobacterium sp. N4-1P]
MVIGVLGLQGAVREHLEMLASLGVKTRIIKSAEDLEGIAGLVLPGGESTAMRRLIDRYALLVPLRQKIKTLPMFGTCAGMILLATELEQGDVHLGAIPMKVKRNAFGRQVDSFETMLAVDGIGADIEAVFIRAPYVERIDQATRVLARIDDEIVVVETDMHLACSFHPELTNDTCLHRYFIEKVKQQRSVHVI